MIQNGDVMHFNEANVVPIVAGEGLVLSIISNDAHPMEPLQSSEKSNCMSSGLIYCCGGLGKI